MENRSEFTWEIDAAGLQAEKWDNGLLNAEDATVFQSWHWGEYKRSHGWQPIRCLGRDKSGRIAIMAQILLKRLPLGIQAGWSPGGPVLQFKGWTSKHFGTAHESLWDTLCARYDKLWLRFHSHIQNDPELAYALSGKFHRPFFKINSEFTSFIDLTRSQEEFEKGMTGKHRYYTKQSVAQGMTWKFGNDEEMRRDFAKLHEEMTREKGMESIRVSASEINNMVSELGDHALILNGYHEGEAVTSCLVQRFGNRGFYASAATGRKGRDISAAYAMIHQLFGTLKDSGIRRLDFAGLDPKTPAAYGVNHFKRGFGGEMVEYLGEWERASSEKLRLMINLGIWKRGGRL